MPGRPCGSYSHCYKLFDVMQSRTGASGAAIVRRAIATSGSPTNAIAMKFVVGVSIGRRHAMILPTAL